MRVLFDAYWWCSGSAAVRRVMREVVIAWAAEFPDDHICLVVRRRHLEDVRKEVAPETLLVPSRMRPQAALAVLGTSYAARTFKPDLVISHNFASLSKNSAVFLHDVLFKTNPEWFTIKERIYFSTMIPLARRSDVVIASSRNEASRIRRFVRETPVVAAGISVAGGLLEAPTTDGFSTLTSRRFMLAVGRLTPRKNLARTIAAALEADLATPQFPLVVVGAAEGSSAALPPGSDEAVNDRRLIFTGFVTDIELKWLYQNARLSVYVSMDEGYGMPPLESLALGTPVVVSDIDVMRENLGIHATYADPTDVASIAQAMTYEASTELTQERIQSLRAHGSSLTWAQVVSSIRHAAEEFVND
ncbi:MULTISPECIES: glycosyltransferase family 1 protein [Aeromicrobium]|uniref:glycosyltransferase family 4 protein n=1 Tax=Aeromicrobium TaxID=2040 RepID=UPI0009EA3D5F|nr:MULTISPECIES: glycosyltransferase family 1 protein [Aeromicrobium]MCL8249800.1 glycosyltransferase family 4 protein [Aeromicrobium fastidiosum]